MLMTFSVSLATSCNQTIAEIISDPINTITSGVIGFISLIALVCSK